MGFNSKLGEVGMVVGNGVDVHWLSPVPIEDGFIDFMENFQYLKSCNSRDGELSREVSEHLAKAARMFGCLCSSIFVNKRLPINTKRCVYIVTILSIWG